MRVGRAEVLDMLGRAPTRLSTRPLPEEQADLLQAAGLERRRETVPPVVPDGSLTARQLATRRPASQKSHRRRSRRVGWLGTASMMGQSSMR